MTPTKIEWTKGPRKPRPLPLWLWNLIGFVRCFKMLWKAEWYGHIITFHEAFWISHHIHLREYKS